MLAVNGTAAQTGDVLDVYVTHAPASVADLYAHYLNDWEEGVRTEAELLDDPDKAAALAALEDDDLETLSVMGFEDPSFFYRVLDGHRLATDRMPVKGGGFSCWR